MSVVQHKDISTTENHPEVHQAEAAECDRHTGDMGHGTGPIDAYRFILLGLSTFLSRIHVLNAPV